MHKDMHVGRQPGKTTVRIEVTAFMSELFGSEELLRSCVCTCVGIDMMCTISLHSIIQLDHTKSFLKLPCNHTILKSDPFTLARILLQNDVPRMTCKL
jgi:hypothetical protein